MQVPRLVGSAGHVNIASYNRKVLLTGEVPTEADRANIEQAVARVERADAHGIRVRLK